MANTTVDIRLALEQLGTGWQFGGSVTDGTHEAWEAVVWEDKRDKPTWEQLQTAYAAIAKDVALAPLRATREALLGEYDKNIAALSRVQRLATTDDERTAIATQIAAWDAYAVALCSLPEQDGAPWADSTIPWPTPPKATEAALGE